MTQTTLRFKISIWYEVDGESPEIRESAHTWHKLPEQNVVREKAVSLIDNFYDVVTK